MKLGARILLSLAVLLAALLATTAYPLIRLVLGEFDHIEQEMAFSRAEDVRRAVESLQSQQASSVSDWANWDAMVRFVQDQNPEFQQENLAAKTLEDLKLEALLIFDISGALVWGRSIDQEEVNLASLDADLQGLGSRASSLCVFEDANPVQAGLLRVGDGGLRVVTAAPILSSEREGPPHGTVIMVARFGPEQLAELATGLDVVLLESEADPSHPQGDRVIVQLVDDRMMQVHIHFRDLGGKPLVLQASLPRHIHRQGVWTLVILGGFLLGVLALFGGLYFLALRRMVVSRVERLGREVLRIAEGSQAGDAVALSGQDELARLAADINRVLAKREEVNRTLVENRQQYDELFERMLNGFAHHEIICDPQGRPVDYRFLSVNPAFERMTGLKAEAVVGRSVLEVLPATESFWIETYGHVALTGEAVQFENGSAELGKHFEISAFRPAPGQFACIFSDVTERKRSESRIKELLDEAMQARGALLGILEDQQRAERALRKSQMDMATILNNLPLMAWMKDREGRFLAVNQLFASACGHASPESVVGKTDLDVWPRDLAERYRADDEQVIRTGVKRTLEEPLELEGGRRWFETYKAPLRNEQGEVIGTTGFSQDITERKEAEQKREEMQVQLQQAQRMESVGRLAGGIAHDFNNMLQIILGNVELLQMQAGADSVLRSALQEIQKAARHSAELTQQLLAYARKQTTLPKVLDLNQKIGNMLPVLRRLLGEGVDLHWIPGPSRAMLKMDPAQIDQIVINLILNARDALTVGGQVTLETRLLCVAAQDKSRLPALVPGAYVCLEVADTGCGMTEKVMSNIFEPFFTTKPLGKGTGLGLPTVYGIVKQNGGDVTVRSEVGKGSSFHIYLPLTSEAPSLSESAPLVVSERRGCESVLVAEDEEGVRRMLKLTLESLGYSVHACENPLAALEAARVPGANYNLLVTDVVMPGMSGSDLVRELKKIHPASKCLFISGYPAESIAQRGVEESATAFLHKPFTREELALKVRAVLDA